VNWFLVSTNVKTKYRKSILEARHALSTSEIDNLSLAIIKTAIEELDLENIETLGSYLSVNNEVKIDVLTNKRNKKNLITTLPVIGPNQSMKLIAPRNSEKLNKNKYDIFEPSNGSEIDPIEHNIIIIPAVGIDKNGFRLGYGGGYYDRFLMSVLGNKNRPLLIGLIYDFQFIDDSINEVHDIKLDIVFSEKQIKKFS